MKEKTILLISAPVGAGHVRAAEAIAEAVRLECNHINPVICNVFDFFSPTAGKAILNGYLKILEFFPQLYGKMYNAGNQSKLILKAREYVNRYLAGRMYKFISEYDPALIISTHATPAGLVACLKKQARLKAPAVAVITDYVVHRLWVYPELDKYFIADAQMIAGLTAGGVKKENIKVTGIPVLPVFGRSQNKPDIYNNLDLAADKPTLLIMGGGEGILPIAEILEALGTLSKKAPSLSLQVIIVAGKNKSLYNRLSSYLNKNPFAIKLYGYVGNIHELMAVSDILISKPGGMTCAEAFSSGLPLLIYRPLPGQETENARYLTGKKAAVLTKSPAELIYALEHILLQNPDILANLKQKATAIKKPFAAFDILNCLKEHLS